MAQSHQQSILHIVSRSCMHSPRSCKRGNNLVPWLDSLHVLTCRHDDACELVSHYEARSRRLMAPEDVQFTSA